MNCLPNLRHRSAFLAFACGAGSVVALGFTGTTAMAQAAAAGADSAFLACSRFEDRGQRIACLEDTLEAATTTQSGTTPATAATPASSEPTIPERIKNFGHTQTGTDISVDASGQDRLHDSIGTLARRNNLWIVTLASGQVWRQTYPRTLLLKEGDSIEIYREGIGNGYRLATPRLNGFIRVERVE